MVVKRSKCCSSTPMPAIDLNEIWMSIRHRAQSIIQQEPSLSLLLESTVLHQSDFAASLTHRLARKLENHAASVDVLHQVFAAAFENDPSILQAVAADMIAVKDRDPACPDILTPLLYFKGFQALSCYRVAHYLWQNDRTQLAFYLQSLIAETFAVDIHPAAKIGSGILLDHATGFVAGETSVIQDDVSILHAVTLGGTGKERGDRHPKIQSGVLLGAGAKILGNVTIGEGAKVGAGSVVLKDVPAHCSVAGVPAQIVGRAAERSPALKMCHRLDS